MSTQNMSDERTLKVMGEAHGGLYVELQDARAALNSALEEITRLQESGARFNDEARAEIARLSTALAAAERTYAEECAVVNRIWALLGNPTYEELKGRSIYDLILELQSALQSEQAKCAVLGGALRPFTDAVHAKSLSQALGHITREDLLRAHDALYASPWPTSDVARAFDAADDKDWDHLFRMLPDSGHGQFWKRVLSEVQVALSALRSQRNLGKEGSS